MKTEKISDVLQGMDVNTEDAIVTLSDKIWEIGSIDEIRQQVSDVTFTFHVVTNVIGNCQGDGWMSIVEYHADLLPYISSAMYEIGLDKVGEATKNIANIFPLDISVLSDSEFCKVVNFMKGHKTDLEELKKYSESEQEKMSEQCKHSVNHVFSSPTSIINFTSKKPSYDDTRRSGRDNELLQRAQNDL